MHVGFVSDPIHNTSLILRNSAVDQKWGLGNGRASPPRDYAPRPRVENQDVRSIQIVTLVQTFFSILCMRDAFSRNSFAILLAWGDVAQPPFFLLETPLITTISRRWSCATANFYVESAKSRAQRSPCNMIAAMQSSAAFSCLDETNWRLLITEVSVCMRHSNYSQAASGNTSTLSLLLSLYSVCVDHVSCGHGPSGSFSRHRARPASDMFCIYLCLVAHGKEGRSGTFRWF